MATENGILDLSYEAGEDLSSDQYRIVTLSSAKVQRPDAVTDMPAGVLQNAPESGEAATVRAIGVSKIVLGATTAENAMIGAEYVDATDAGKGTPLTADKSLITGRCIVGGDEDELGEIMLSGNPFYISAT